ncbi:MAG: type IV pilus secretin PilQ [Burkholderiales bacterium]
MNTLPLPSIGLWRNWRERHASLVIFAAGLLAFAVPQAHAQMANSIDAINVSNQGGGQLVVRMTFREPLANPPAGFSVNNPPRIALDLPDVTNNMGKNVIEANDGDLRSINVVQASNRTRVVMNLIRPLSYTTQVDGNTLLITMQGAAAVSSGAVTAPVVQFAPAQPGTAGHSLRDIDFRRGNNGEGRIIVDLSDNSTGIDIKQLGKKVVVEFINTALPQNLQRRLDVADFGTPVTTVETSAQGKNVRLTVEPRGLWEHSAYQTDTQFILEVKPLKEDPNKLVQSSQPGYSGEKLSLNFQNIEVRAVLQVIADFTGLNIITSDSVTGNTTLRLKDVPWDQALDIILQSKGLAKRKNGNVVLIAPADELATKEKLALEAGQQISDLEPLRTESMQLNYTKAEAFSRILTDDKQKILSKRGSAVWDPRTNIMFVQDTPAKLEEIRRLITKIDVPIKQVLIESRIVIATDKFSKQLGVRFGNQSGHRVGNTAVGVSGNIGGSSSIASGTIPSGSGDLNVNLPASGGGSLGLTFLNLGNGNLVNLELSALETDNRGKVISSPRVITSDKQKAFIEQGTEIPYLQASSSGATNVAFKPAVLSLAVTPQITPDDKIILDLEVKKDSVGQIFSGIPSIDTKKVNTQILLDNGETAVLGGVYEQNINDAVDKVPFFGDLPFIGNLFKRTTRQDDKTELLIFITPKIVKDNLTAR